LSAGWQGRWNPLCAGICVPSWGRKKQGNLMEFEGNQGPTTLKPDHKVMSSQNGYHLSPTPYPTAVAPPYWKLIRTRLCFLGLNWHQPPSSK
jgi:hypothetical protein